MESKRSRASQATTALIAQSTSPISIRSSPILLSSSHQPPRLTTSSSSLLLDLLSDFEGRLSPWSSSHRARSHSSVVKNVTMSYELLPRSMETLRETHRSLICLDIVKKACSTLVAFLAEVSRKGIPSWSANSYGTVVNQLDPFNLDTLAP